MKTPEEIAAEIVPDDANGAPALRALAVEAIKRDREQRDHMLTVVRENSKRFQGQVLLARRSLSEALHFLAHVGLYTDETILISEETQAFMDAGQKIQAIKQLRDDNPGLGLGEAKHFMDRRMG